MDRLKVHFSDLGKIPFHCEFSVGTLEMKDFLVIEYGKVIEWNLSEKPLSIIGCFLNIAEKKKSEKLLEKQSQFLKDLTYNQSHMMCSKFTNIMWVLDMMYPKMQKT